MSESPRASRSGITLVELLVSLAIVGALITAVVSLSSRFLDYSRRSTLTNSMLADLNDAMGYVTLNVRRAMVIVGGDTTMVIREPSGDTFECAAVSSEGPCIALVVPTIDDAAQIIGYELLAYRVVPIGAWADNPGVPNGWSGPATPLLLEYRAVLCTSCPVPVAAGSTVEASRSSLVIANLVLQDAAGAAFAPFTVVANDTRVVFRLRMRGAGTADAIRVPSDGPLVLSAVRRP